MTQPRIPAAPPTRMDALSMVESRDAMTGMAPEPAIRDAVLSAAERWRADPQAATPLQDLRAVLECVRRRPRGDARVQGMNTIVRTLGRRHVLAAFLDILRHAAAKEGTAEQEIALTSQRGKMHSIYGWSGQTTMVLSSPEPTEGTSFPQDADVVDRLGYPQPLWWISIHIWQPNPKAKGFASGQRPEPAAMMEPPHSHPFDFASMMSIGSMRQSIYAPIREGVAEGRYGDVPLEQVDGVWPPHRRRETVRLRTIEDRVPIEAGDSYFMPFHRIHDVEVEAEGAVSRPAVTLFLASESLDMADVYMARSMAEHHERRPDILEDAVPLELDAWRGKLEATAAYLRGDIDQLDLSDIVGTDNEYAFLHV